MKNLILPLTQENVKNDMIIINKHHLEWGTWRVLQEDQPGIWSIRGKAGEKVLFDDDFDSWSVIKDPTRLKPA